MDISRLILIYLCIAIACIFWQPTIVLGNSKQAETVLNAFNIDLTNYNTLNNINQSSQAGSSTSGLLRQGNPSSGATVFLNIIDGLFNAMGYIILLFILAIIIIGILIKKYYKTIEISEN